MLHSNKPWLLAILLLAGCTSLPPAPPQLVQVPCPKLPPIPPDLLQPLPKSSFLTRFQELFSASPPSATTSQTSSDSPSKP